MTGVFATHIVITQGVKGVPLKFKLAAIFCIILTALNASKIMIRKN